MRFKDWHGKEHDLPAGREVSWRPSANAIILDDRKVLLVRVKQHGLWELPGGGIELEEYVVDALVREVFEETGYRIELLDPVPVFMEDNFFYAPDIDMYFHALPMVFRAALKNRKQDASAIDFQDEIYEVGWFPLDALPKDLHGRSARALACKEH